MSGKIQKGSLYDAARQLLRIVPKGTEVHVEVRFETRKVAVAPKSRTPSKKANLPQNLFQPKNEGKSKSEPTAQSIPKKGKNSRRMNKRVYSDEICDGSDSQMATESIFPEATFIPKEDADSFRSNSKLPVQYKKTNSKKEVGTVSQNSSNDETYEEFGNKEDMCKSK